jgi:hypothetical protein
MIRTAFVCLLALAAGAFAQGPGARGPRPMGPGGPGGGRFLGAEAGMPGRVVKNAPYSADVVTESTQTLGDGNHIRQTSNGKFYRDSEGRTRQEQSLNGLSAIAGSTTLPHVVFIHDPVAGHSLALNVTDKTATKSLQRPGRGNGGPPPPPAGATTPGTGQVSDQAAGPHMRGVGRGPGRSANSQNVKTESLGRQTMEGVVVDGTRTTLTIPAGQMGNEQPINVVTERWYSAELQAVVLLKRSDPRNGETVTKLANVSRAEPSRTLFEAPADYKVTETTHMRPGGPSKGQ